MELKPRKNCSTYNDSYGTACPDMNRNVDCERDCQNCVVSEWTNDGQCEVNQGAVCDKST